MNLPSRRSPLGRSAAPVGPVAATEAERAAPDRSLSAAWRSAAIAIAAAGAVFGLVFHHDMAAAVTVWLGSTAYNHCFLILPLVGFLLWDRRVVLSAATPSPIFWPLLAMPLLSAVWLLSAVLDLNEGRQLMVVAMFETTLLATLGPRVFRLLLAPLLFLFFLVPSGAFLVPTLQRVTADIVVHGLQFLHIPVFSDGFMIDIPEGRFEIAEACAGLRFLIASIVFGCFFAVVMYRSHLRRALFIALSLTVPVAANGMRALGIIVLAHLEGSAAAVEADHVIYGWLFFSVVILLLIAIGTAFVDKGARLPPIRPAGATPYSPGRFVAAIAAALLLAVAGPGYAARLDASFPASALPVAAGPQIDAPWRPVTDRAISWRPVVLGADREIEQGFEAPGSGVVLRYVALYRLRAVGNRLTNTENRIADDWIWHVTYQSGAVISAGGKSYPVTATQIVSGPRRRLVWSFYLVDGQIAAGLLQTKLLQARAVLLRRVPVAAFVAISASMDDPDQPAARQLAAFLQANRPLFTDLNGSGRGTEPGHHGGPAP
jgi:exosortase A